MEKNYEFPRIGNGAEECGYKNTLNSQGIGSAEDPSYDGGSLLYIVVTLCGINSHTCTDMYTHKNIN